MYLYAMATAIGKRQSTFKNEAGESITSYIGNASQNNGELVTEIKLNKSQFDAWDAGHNYRITCKYGKSRNGGGYLQILDISSEPGK